MPQVMQVRRQRVASEKVKKVLAWGRRTVLRFLQRELAETVFERRDAVIVSTPKLPSAGRAIPLPQCVVVMSRRTSSAEEGR